jgi:hypothetical protein
MDPTVPKALAWRRFFVIASARMAWANTNFIEEVHGQGFRRIPNQFNCTRPMVEMEEELFQNKAFFSISYNILGAPMAYIIQSSGLWQPFVGATARGVNGEQRITSATPARPRFLGQSWKKTRKSMPSECNDTALTA